MFLPTYNTPRRFLVLAALAVGCLTSIAVQGLWADGLEFEGDILLAPQAAPPAAGQLVFKNLNMVNSFSGSGDVETFTFNQVMAAQLAGDVASGPRPTLNLDDAWVRFTDKGNMRLALLDQELELQTDFGKLKIPLKDVHKIEFGSRLSDADQKRLDEALQNLNSENVAKYQAASKTLIELRVASYSRLAELSKEKDKTTAQRASEVMQKISASPNAGELRKTSKDIVYTADSIIAGRVTNAHMRVSTKQFGEQKIQLADMRSINHNNTPQRSSMPTNVIPDPGSLQNISVQLGGTYYIRVTGNAGAGTVWGSDVYTTDSHLASVCVHAGVVAAGETAVVKITTLPSPNQFLASSRNGVNSHPYGQYPLAFKVEKVEE